MRGGGPGSRRGCYRVASVSWSLGKSLAGMAIFPLHPHPLVPTEGDNVGVILLGHRRSILLPVSPKKYAVFRTSEFIKFVPDGSVSKLYGVPVPARYCRPPAL